MRSMYKQRDTVLKALGYESYQAYLASPLWAHIKQQAYGIHGTKCLICSGIAQVIHHIGYGRAVLTGQSFSQLAPLCNECHRNVEYDPDGKKRRLCAAQTAYSRLLNKAHGERRPRCLRCSGFAKAHSRYCSPCARLLRQGRERFPSMDLPICQGKGCTHQAKIGSRYCSIHEVDPNLALSDYMEFRRRAGKAGISLAPPTP